MHKVLLSFLLTTGLLLLSSVPVKAADQNGVIMERENRMERLEQRKVENAERVAERCTTAGERSKKILGQYSENYPKHLETYKKMTTRINAVVTHAKANGRNTTELEASLKTLSEKVALLDTQVQAATAQLTIVQGYACGNSQGQFVIEMKKARELAKTVHKTMQEIRTYYQQTVRPGMKRLAAEARAKETL